MANSSGVTMDQGSVKLGLLMETAQSHQKLAEAAIQKLNEHAQGLEAVLREQIRQGLAEELKGVRAEAEGAATALRALKRAANARATFWTLGLAAMAAGITVSVAWWVLPTPSEIAELRTERDALKGNVAVLNQRGARADLRRCGAARLCVRVDVKAPRYGEHFDYLVVNGY
jgi:hypothetical protein